MHVMSETCYSSKTRLVKVAVVKGLQVFKSTRPDDGTLDHKQSHQRVQREFNEETMLCSGLHSRYRVAMLKVPRDYVRRDEGMDQ
jgi:hypothetical protein